jgi:hypothetical protein
MTLNLRLGSNSQLLIFGTFVLAIGKLMGKFALSWFMVFAPIWIPIACLLVYLLFALAFLVFMFIPEAIGSIR